MLCFGRICRIHHIYRGFVLCVILRSSSIIVSLSQNLTGFCNIKDSLIIFEFKSDYPIKRGRDIGGKRGLKYKVVEGLRIQGFGVLIWDGNLLYSFKKLFRFY